MAVEVDTRLWWESSTPLGTPVLPLVYITTATSSGPGGLGGTGASSPILYGGIKHVKNVHFSNQPDDRLE